MVETDRVRVSRRGCQVGLDPNRLTLIRVNVSWVSSRVRVWGNTLKVLK
jgi:hypothetical protein